MKKTVLLTIVLAFLLFNVQKINAQTKTHELGLRFSDLDNFHGIYKKQTKPNRFFRITVGNLHFSNQNRNTGVSIYSFGANVTCGFERHKPISKKLSFVHGFEPGIGYYQTYTSNQDISNINLSFRLGYILGLQYKLNENIFIGIDISPEVSSKFIYTNGEMQANIYSLNADISKLFVNLTYRFSK